MDNSTKLTPILHDPQAWLSHEILEENYKRKISTSECDDIHDYLTLHSQKAKKAIYNFDLQARLSSLIQDIFYRLIHGYGFVVIEDFSAVLAHFSFEIQRNFLVDFCSFLGVLLKQNQQHDVVFNVKSISGLKLSQQDSRGPYVEDFIPMHTDRGCYFRYVLHGCFRYGWGDIAF